MSNHGLDDVQLLSACPLIPGLDDHGCFLHIILRPIIFEYWRNQECYGDNSINSPSLSSLSTPIGALSDRRASHLLSRIENSFGENQKTFSKNNFRTRQRNVYRIPRIIRMNGKFSYVSKWKYCKPLHVCANCTWYESYASVNHILEGSETVSNGVEDVIHCFIHGTNDLKGTW